MSAWIGLGILAVAAIILMLQSGGDTVGGMEQGDFASIITGVALLIFVGSGMFASYRGQGSKALKDAGIWLAVLLALLTVYSFRFEFQTIGRRVASELMPGSFTNGYLDPNGEYVVEIPKNANGHFVTRVRINGAPIKMMVDTGASSVVLTQQDAQRAGFDTSRLSYSIPVSTANGRARVAMARLHAISIGDIGVSNIQAHIAAPGALDQSLLGMSFLSRLRSYEVREGVLILRR